MPLIDQHATTAEDQAIADRLSGLVDAYRGDPDEDDQDDDDEGDDGAASALVPAR